MCVCVAHKECPGANCDRFLFQFITTHSAVDRVPFDSRTYHYRKYIEWLTREGIYTLDKCADDGSTLMGIYDFNFNFNSLLFAFQFFHFEKKANIEKGNHGHVTFERIFAHEME